MMKRIKTIVAVLLAAMMLCTVAFASAPSGFHAGLAVDRANEAQGQIVVRVEDSSVLQDKKPTLTIPCTFDYAKVTGPDGAEVSCTISNDQISFTVAAGGDYTIEKTDAPASGGGTVPPVGGYTPPVQEPWVNPFSDVKQGEWYYASVAKVCQAGLMNGTEDGTTFSPAMKLTRSMLMTMLARLDGVDTKGGATWYEKGMKWAVEKKVSDGTNPEANVTREQIAVMLYRYAGSPVVSGNRIAAYPDKDRVSSWAENAMNWAVAQGIIKGADGKLNAQGEATRMEVATMVARYMTLLGK